MASNQLRHHHPQNYCNEPPNSNMSMIGTIIIMTTIVFIITIGIFIITVIKITTDVNEIGVKRSLPDLSYYHKISYIKTILTCCEMYKSHLNRWENANYELKGVFLRKYSKFKPEHGQFHTFHETTKMN